MKNLLLKIYRFILLKIIGKPHISTIANMYEVSSSIKILENDFGHLKSIEKQIPLDVNDNPLPWYTYPAIEYISQLDLKDKTVFEWGSGNSSLYFAKRAKHIISVEDDEKWYNKNYSSKLDNQEIYFAGVENYEKKIEEAGLKFDIIIIDGNKRAECAKIAPSYLKEGGIIILDNSDWYKKTAKFLRGKNYIQIDFHGFGPINQYNWTTSFFFDRKFNFKTVNDIQPANPIGGLLQECD